MHRLKSLSHAMTASLILAGTLATPGESQVGRRTTVIDPNVVDKTDLRKVPHLSDAMVDRILERRPFLSMTELDAFLRPSLNEKQLTEVYGKMFIAVNLNSATREEIRMIPGGGAKVVDQFLENRPYRSLGQFRREIGKNVIAKDLAYLEQYVFVPVNLNTASDEDILSIPGVGKRMLHEFKEYRPYKTIEQFRREIGKYVNDRELARLERYVTLD
ncbi:MAG: hypothetical protein ABR543_10980 [Gemmatimonadaceae bacterium]